MTRLKYPDPSGLLSDLQQMGSAGRAEGEAQEKFPKTFHPVAEHARAFDPNVVLVIGPRGSGKTELFKAVIQLNLLPAIQRCLPNLGLPDLKWNRVTWKAGYPIGREFPDFRGLKTFLIDNPKQPDEELELWFAYLVRILWNELPADTKGPLSELKRIAGADVNAVHQAFHQADSRPLLALDRLDAELEKRDKYIFVGYDELDTLGSKNWEAMQAGIRGLVGFWATYTRRWKRIRAKIFLRTDLFRRYGIAGGADLAKLAANRVELIWNDKNLYAMLLKRIVNAGPELGDYIKNTGKINFDSDPDLGDVPRLSRSEDARPIVERMVGPFMGANVKKGLTYWWLLNHIRDGRGQALPRPLVRIIESAAEIQKSSGHYAESPRLLEPTSLRRALDNVSQEHVLGASHEWPWLEGLANRLRGEQVPWERRPLERKLEQEWESPWGQKDTERPIVDSARELIDYLVEVGIFRARFDHRIDVPDLFLAGLGLKRKGGVRKK